MWSRGSRIVAPSRGRGSKQPVYEEAVRRRLVAPSRGRGSKRSSGGRLPSSRKSPLHGGVDRNSATRPEKLVEDVAPSRGRGSKLRYRRAIQSPPRRPFTGAWIETTGLRGGCSASAGRPFTGAWIETSRPRMMRAGHEVAPSRGRGSKRCVQHNLFLKPGRPFTGAWIETPSYQSCQARSNVAPSRGRGSKHEFVPEYGDARAVAPSRGRGSKPVDLANPLICNASPLHGGVDRNRLHVSRHSVEPCRPFTGAWIETICSGSLW